MARAALLLTLLAAGPLAGQQAVAPDVGLDHVILAVPNLARGMELFARLTGVTPKRGGQHPGRGTENALVSLGGDRYLEILAPIAKGADSSATAGAEPVALLPAGWAMHTHALEAVIARVSGAGVQIAGPFPGSRRTPDNALLAWRTASVSGAGLELAPFFIEWAPGTPHPSTTSPAGCRLARLALAQPDTTRLSAFFTVAGYRPELAVAKAAGMQLVLDCPRGRITFPQ